MSAPGCRYEIRLAETLEGHWAQWFAEMEIVPANEADGCGTLLRGTLPDQAAFFGLLGRVRDLNLTLIEARRVEE